MPASYFSNRKRNPENFTKMSQEVKEIKFRRLDKDAKNAPFNTPLLPPHHFSLLGNHKLGDVVYIIS